MTPLEGLAGSTIDKIRQSAATPARPTVDDIRSSGAVMSVPKASAALGISESYGYQLAREGRFPAKTVLVGSRIRVLTRSILELLGEAA